MDIKTYLIEHYPDEPDKVEEYIESHGEYIDHDLRSFNVEAFLIYLYPERQELIETYIKWNEVYLDAAFRDLYKKVDEETVVEIMTEMIMNEVLSLSL